MQRLYVALLVWILLPVGLAFAQVTETPSTLGVKLASSSPFSYKDEQGYTVVLGEVENTKTFAVKNVKVWAGFYSGKASGRGEPPLETVTGQTLLDVIPPKAKSPFIIKSKTPNPEISQVTVNILGFNSAPSKQQLLQVAPQTLLIGDTIMLPVTVTNNGQIPATNIQIHLIAFDAFMPPRVVGIQSIQVDELGPAKSTPIEFDEKMDYRANSFKVVAESDEYQSKTTDVSKISLNTMTRLISINDVRLIDQIGEPVSEIRAGQTVNITSNLSIQFSALTKQEQPYVFYVQVKQFGQNAIVEYIGIFEGKFNSAQTQTVSIPWTPQNEGGYFIETYVWDQDGVPLAAPGKVIPLVLVTP